VVLVAKFAEGAWITLLFIPMLIVIFRQVRGHYHAVTVAITTTAPVQPAMQNRPPIVVVPIERWNRIAKQGLELASQLSAEIIAVHVEPGEHHELLQEDWERYVEPPFRAAGVEPPKLVILPSPYRFVIVPLVQYILELCEKHPSRRINVVIPELVEERWYEYFLHNQRARLLEWMLLVRGNERISTVTSPYHLPKNA